MSELFFIQPTFMSAPDDSEVISLFLPKQLRVAGEKIVGEVHLNFAQLQNTPLEEVHVKLRGSVFTYATTFIAAVRIP